MDESLQSVELKDAVTDLKEVAKVAKDLREVAKDMKETSVRMQNATQAFVEGQKNREFKKGDDKDRKACKRFRQIRKLFRKCLRSMERSRKSNVTSK